MNQFPWRWSTLAVISSIVVALSSSCGTDVDRDVEDLVTIDEQGVYGQTVDYKDSWPTEIGYGSYEVKVFQAPHDDQSSAVAKTTSGDQGFFEVPLSAGDFVICVNGDVCHSFTVDSGERVRVDYQSGDPGWYEPQNP